VKILYIGDIVAKSGRTAVKHVLPGLIADKQIDFVIAQGENLSTGNGLRPESVKEMQDAGVNVFTGGNHTWKKKEIYPMLDDPKGPVLRPANYPEGVPGSGWRVFDTPFGKVLVVSLLGQIVGGGAPQLDNPLRVVDAILEENKNEKLAATIVNFHGDFSSEKVAIGFYLDGRVTAVVGDHTHVPTADARVLPGGTAHISDVGMVGPIDTVLGVKKEIIIQRWLDQLPARHEWTTGESRFCSVLIDVDPKTGLAKSIEQILINVPA
jgi:metallophosphoesterase (TIGR00282 family)